MNANIKELRELGVIHELNRNFLHPLGLALVVNVNDDGTEFLGNILDCRDEDEGIFFATLDSAKMEKFKKFQKEREAKRIKALGFVIQS